MNFRSQTLQGICVGSLLFAVSTAVYAEEPKSIAQHIVMIHAHTVPIGINRYFPALVVDATDSKSTLVSASWGAEPFPIPNMPVPIGSIHLLDSDQAVEIVNYSEKLGVAVFTVDIPLKPWSIDQLATEIEVGDYLEELILDNKHYRPIEENQHLVRSIRAEFPYTTADGTEVKIKGTVVFDDRTSGNPGTILLKNGKLAAVFLNNSSEDGSLKRHALPARLLLARYRRLLSSK